MEISEKLVSMAVRVDLQRYNFQAEISEKLVSMAAAKNSAFNFSVIVHFRKTS